MSREGKPEVRGILKNSTKARGHEDKGGEGGIQWDEMNIMMTEHPADKDYGHMKIEEPKTPYHEMMPDEEEAGPSSPQQQFSPEDLALKVQQASTKSPGEWGEEEMSSGEDDTSEERKEHKKQFAEWRKKHYNEFYAVKRAKELMRQDEEELRELERQEQLEKANKQGEAPMDQGKS